MLLQILGSFHRTYLRIFFCTTKWWLDLKKGKKFTVVRKFGMRSINLRLSLNSIVVLPFRGKVKRKNFLKLKGKSGSGPYGKNKGSLYSPVWQIGIIDWWVNHMEGINMWAKGVLHFWLDKSLLIFSTYIHKIYESWRQSYLKYQGRNTGNYAQVTHKAIYLFAIMHYNFDKQVIVVWTHEQIITQM